MRQTLLLYNDDIELSRIVSDDTILNLPDGLYQVTDDIIAGVKTCDISDYNASHIEVVNG